MITCGATSSPLSSLTHLCAIFLMVAPCLSACGSAPAPTPPLEVGRAVPASFAEDTRSVIPPSRFSEAVRLPYLIGPELEGGGEQGVIEAGSWAAFSILRVVHGDPALAVEANLDADLAGLGSWLGPDGEPYTPDDRPYVSLQDLEARLQPSPRAVGWLLWRARRSPLALPADPSRWHSLEGHAMTSDDVASVLATVNQCSVTALHERFGLPSRAARSLIGRRPVGTIVELDDLPYLSRSHVVLLAHLAPRLACGEVVGEGELAERLLQGPEVQRLRWLYTAEHFAQVQGELRRLLDERIDAMRARGAAEPEVEDAVSADLARWVELRVLHPFEAFEPAEVDRDDEERWRAVAGERLLHWFATTDLRRLPLAEDYAQLVQRRSAVLFDDLAALHHGYARWEVMEQGVLWIVVGRLWGLYCEVTVDREAMAVAQVYVELD